MINLSSLAAHLQKPLAVLGLGKTGLSVLAACQAAGIPAVLWDDKEEQRALAAEKGGVIEDLGQADFRRFSALCAAPGIYAHPALARAAAAGVEVFCDIELFHRARGNVRTIGITGTNGKSTTTALIGHILHEARMPSAVGGNIGQAILTLPDLPAASIYVIEMSSYQIGLCPTFTPDVAVHINFSPDHLDRHGGMDGYVAAKERMFRGKGTAIVGIDDAWSQGLFDRVRAAGQRAMIPVSCHAAAQGGVKVTADGILFDHHQRILDLNTCPNLKGAHNWQNAAMAYAACHAVGAPLMEIVKGMQSFTGLAHRQNIVATLNGVQYVNDSKATNDQAAAVALSTFDDIYWIAGGRPKDGGYKDCEKHLARVRHAFLLGEAEEALAKWLHGRKIPYTRCGTLGHAVHAAHDMAQAHGRGTVLLSPACASWDQFRSFEHRGDAFVEMVRALETTQGSKRA